MTPGIRRLAAVAADGGHARRADDAAGRLARGARIRPEADPGVRHRQPARPDHPDGRRGRQRPDAGRAGHAVRARDVQGRAVHGRRRHRPRHRHPRHPPAGLARAAQQAAARSSPSARPPAWPRCRRSSASSPRRPTSKPSLHSAVARRARRPSCSPASCSARCSPPSTACGSCWGAFGRKGLPQPSTRVAEMHRPAADFPDRRRRSWPSAGLLFGAVAGRRSTTSSTTTPTRCPAATRLRPRAVARVRPAAAAVGARARRSAPRRTSAGPGCAGCGSARRRWATPTASTTPPCAALDVLSVRLTAVTQRGSIPATQSVILSTLVLVPVDRAGARRPRPARLRAVGLAAAGRGRAADRWPPRSARP